MLFTVTLIYAAYLDYKTKTIPNTVIVTTLILSVICSAAPVLERIAGFLIPAVPLFFIALKNKGLKGGDIKYLSAVGAYLGLTTLAKALIPATITAVIWGFAHKEKSVPLATVFCIGYFIYIAVNFSLGGLG